MPDTLNNGNYNRANDFLDQGYANLNPSAAPTQFPQVPQEGAQESTAPTAKEIFDSIGQNLRQTATQENPFISSIKFTTPVRTPLDQTLRYNSPRYGYNPFNPELEHQYAERQGWFNAWKNNILKFGAQAGGTFLETVTAIPQVLHGLSEGDLSKIYNNPLSNSIRDWTDGLENTLPNYQSVFEDQHPFLSYIPGFASLKTLGDKWGGILKTLGFVVGSVSGAIVQDALVGAATEGVGELPLLEPQLQAFTGRIGKIFAAPGGAVKLAESIKNGMAVEDAVNGVYSAVKNTDRFRYGLSMFTTAVGGSIIFANGVYNDVKKNLTDEYYKQHGRDPQDGDAQNINEYAKNAGNVDLFANTALQMKVFNDVFTGIFKPTATVLREAESKVPVALEKDSLDVFKSVAPEGKFKILQKVGPQVKTLATTGAEMSGIYAIGRSAENFAQRKFDDPSVSDTDAYMHSMATGLYDTFTTQQGIENILIGVLGGALIHGGKTLMESKRGIENNSDVISKNVLALLNSSKVSDLFKNTYNEAVTSDSLAKSMKKAAQSGDIFEFQNLKYQQLFNFVSSGARAGKYELRVQQLEALKDLSGSEFEKMFSLDYNDTNRRTVSDYVDSVIKKSKDIKENIDKVDKIFKNPFKEGDRKNFIAFEEYKNQLALDLSEMKNNRERLVSLAQEISKTAPLVDRNRLIDLTHEIGIEQTIKRFEDRIAAIDKANELSPKSSDFFKQDNEEKAFLKEKIKELKTGDQVDYHPDLYNTIGEIVNYYANGDKVTGDNNVHPIDLLPLLGNAQDAFKLENANNRALYHYQQLTGKKGFDNYIADTLKANNVNYERYMNNLVQTLTNPQQPKESVEAADTIDINEQGQPIKPADKKETKVVVKHAEESEADRKEAERARKDYEATRAKIEKKNKTKTSVEKNLRDIAVAYDDKEVNRVMNIPIDSIINEVNSRIENNPNVALGALPASYDNRLRAELKDKGVDVNGKTKLTDIQEQINSLKTNEDNVVLSTTKAEEAVDISEIENPEAQQTMKTAQDTKAVAHGTVKNSIYKNADPFVLVNRVYSRDFEDSKENTNLRKAIFTNTPQKLYGKLQVNISKSTKGKKKGEYSHIPKTGIYRSGFGYDIDLVADGDVIGKIQPGDGLFFKRGDEYVPLTEVNKDEYQKVTGNDPSTYNEFINDLKAYQEITDTIVKHHEETGKKTFNNAEVQQLFNIHVKYGRVEYSKGSATSTPLSDVTHQTNGDFVVSVKDGEISILNENELNSVDHEKAIQFLADNKKQIQGINSRYVYVTKLPDGSYQKISAIAARPSEANGEVLTGLLGRIAAITGTTDKKDISKINRDLRNEVFISDNNNRKGSGTHMHLFVNEDGKVYFNVINKDYRKGLFLPDAKTAKNLDELVGQINRVIQRKSSEDGTLAKLNLKLDVKDFKTSIPDAERIGLKELRGKMSVSAPQDIFENYGLHVLPLKSKAASDFKPHEETNLEPEEASLVETLQASIDQLTPEIKENVETLANAGVENQKQLAKTIADVVANDPEGAKEVLPEPVIAKAKEVKPKRARKPVKAKKDEFAEANKVSEDLRHEYLASDEDHTTPAVTIKGDKAYIYKGYEMDKELGEHTLQLYDTKDLTKYDIEEIKEDPEKWLRHNIYDEYFIKDKSIEQTKKVATKAAKEKPSTSEVQVQGGKAPKVQPEKQVNKKLPTDTYVAQEEGRKLSNMGNTNYFKTPENQDNPFAPSTLRDSVQEVNIKDITPFEQPSQSKLEKMGEYKEPEYTKYDTHFPVAIRYNGKLILLDGHHRLELAKKAGKEIIKVAIKDVNDLYIPKAPEVQSKESLKSEVEPLIKTIPEKNRKLYGPIILDNPDEHLKNIAEQVVDPLSEKTTRDTFGDELTDFALQKFPNAKAPGEDLLAKVKEQQLEDYQNDVPLNEALQKQIDSLPKIDVPSLHKAPETVEQVNDKYQEQFNKMNSSLEQLLEKKEELKTKPAENEDSVVRLEREREKELQKNANRWAEGAIEDDVYYDTEKKIDAKYDAQIEKLQKESADIIEGGVNKLKDYEQRINKLQDDIEAYKKEWDKELEIARSKEVGVGDKVVYEGKEVLVTDKTESGNGEPVFTVSDGGQGESTVYRDKIYKVDETLGEPVDLPPAVTKDLEVGDRVWYNNKQYKVVDTSRDKVTLQDKDGNIGAPVVKESIIPHDEAIDDTYAVEYSGLKGILDTLQKRFNIKYQVVNDPEGRWQGRFKDGIVYINKANVDRTTPFHEYLHPFLKVLEIDNPELYKNLSDEFNRLVNESLDDAATEAISETKRLYKDSTPAEQQQEALVRYISKIAAQNVNKEGQKLGGQYNRAMRSLIERFTEWLGKMWDRVFGSKLKNIPTEATLQDMADVISLTDYAFDLKSRMDAVDNMDVFQKSADNFDKEIFERLERNLDKFAKTARRLNSEELGTEAAAVKRIFENKDEAESLNSFVWQGMKGLSWSIDEFKRITGKLKNPENNLTAKEVQEMNRSLDVIKQMVAFYREDVNDLFKRIGDRKSMDDEEYRTYAETLREANVVADKIQTRSVDLMVEWLYPAVEHTNELIKEKYPDFVLSKEDFRKQLYNATGDVDRLFFALGSVGSSKDPVSAIVSNVIKDTVEDAHRYDAVLSHIIKTGYDEFLKKEGLSNDRNTTAEHYKKNFLRKARILEKVGEDEKGEPKYDYVERWAFHQPYFFDKWTEEYEAFVDSLGAPSEDKIVEQARINKMHEWQVENGTINEPAKRFLNPQFHDLYEKDRMFTILYDTYKEGNENLQAEEQLQFGVVPQVSKGKNMFSDLNWSKTGAMNALKQVGRFIHPNAEEGNEFDVNLVNMDGSIYKKIRVAYIRPLDEADLDLALPETVFKFAGVTNMSKSMRELEPNIRTLKSLLDGDSQFIKKARGVVDIVKNSKTGSKGEKVTNTVFASKKAGRLGLVNKQLSAFLDDVVYGDTEVKDTIKTPFGQLDLNKWGNNMAFLTALNNMAFNITAGVSNVIIGDIQAFGEAIGGKYYKPDNYRKAQKQYWSSIGDFTNDVSTLKKSKITQLGIKYDAIQGEFRDKYGKRFVGNVMQKYASADTLFIFNHAGEHHIQLTGMLALMDATKVQTTDGKTISLYDAHEVTPNGYLKLRQDAIWTDAQNNDFTKRLHSLNKILNGNYSKFDKAYLQRKWYGKLALIYRKYLYNAFRARYGKKRLDYELQDVYEGYYRTFYGKLAKDIKAYKFEAARRFLTREGWTADEKYAYNKTMYELGLFTGITMLGIAIGANESKDDDKSWGRDYLTLLMLRARGDIGQYTLFGVPDMVRIMKNPSAVMQALSRYWDFFAQLTTQPSATYKRKTGAFGAGTSVLQAKMLKAIPILRQITNFLSPEEQKKFYTLINKNF